MQSTELENVRAASAAIREQIAALDEAIEQATAAESESVAAAIRAGRVPEPNPEVAELENRKASLQEYLKSAEAVELRAAVDDLESQLAEAEAEKRGISERVAKALAAERKASEKRVAAQNEASAHYGYMLTLREQHTRAVDRLCAADPAFAEELAQKRRAEAESAITPEQHAAVRKTMAAMGGLYILEDEQELAALQREAEKQHSKLTVFGRSAVPPNQGLDDDE